MVYVWSDGDGVRVLCTIEYVAVCVGGVVVIVIIMYIVYIQNTYIHTCVDTYIDEEHSLSSMSVCVCVCERE